MFEIETQLIQFPDTRPKATIVPVEKRHVNLDRVCSVIFCTREEWTYDMKRKLAVGWFDNESFVGSCADHVSRIKEVFFAWPGVTASRPMDDWTPARRSRIVSDLRWARENGIELDAIFNANCYGDIAISETLADHAERVRVWYAKISLAELS